MAFAPVPGRLGRAHEADRIACSSSDGSVARQEQFLQRPFAAEHLVHLESARTRFDGSSWNHPMAAQVRDPLVLVLLAAAVLTTATGDWTNTCVIMLVVVINTAVGVSQEVKADRAITALSKLTAPEARSCGRPPDIFMRSPRRTCLPSIWRFLNEAVGDRGFRSLVIRPLPASIAAGVVDAATAGTDMEESWTRAIPSRCMLASTSR